MAKKVKPALLGGGARELGSIGRRPLRLTTSTLYQTATMNAQQKNDFGERLYAQISPAWDAVSIATVKEVGMWTEGITAGKMTGMALEAYSARELETMLADPCLIAEHMAKCVEAFWQHAEKVERKTQQKHELWVQKNARLREL